MLHAYILTGSREAAVERARELAAEALCQGEPPRPCRACRACRKVFRGVHPDVTVVERRTDESGKPRKEILVDQIRALSAEAVVRPNEGSARVYIFPEAEAMNTSAQNAFLKLLEEPPVQAYFLLCAEDPERLLETVRSRCAQLRLGGAAAAAGKKVRDRAGAFLAALGDPAELLRCCLGMEKLDAAQALETVRCLRETAPERDLPAAELLALEADLARAEAFLQGNVGVRHVMAWLPASINHMK